jgi:DNA polymerase-3 subunit gamma/tau
MRGEIFDIDNKKIFAFGGARSHDIQDGILNLDEEEEIYEYRKRGAYFRIRDFSWWDLELPTNQEMENGIENLEKTIESGNIKINTIENNISTNEIIIEKEEPEEIVYENVKSEDVKLIESSWQKIRQKIKEDKVNKQMPVYFLLGDVSGFNVYNNNLYIIYGHGFEFAKKRLSNPETISYIEQMIRETINRSFSIKIILESEVKNIELEIKNEKVDKGEEILKSIVKDDILEIRDNEEKQD